MKNIILSVAFVGSVLGAPLMASADSFVKVPVHMVFENVNDKYVMESNGVVIFTVTPTQVSQLMAGGEYVAYVDVLDVTESVDINVDVYNSGSIREYYITADGVKTEL